MLLALDVQLWCFALCEPASRTGAQHHAASHTFVLEVQLEALLLKDPCPKPRLTSMLAAGGPAKQYVRRTCACVVGFRQSRWPHEGAVEAAGIALVPPRGYIRQGRTTQHNTPRHEAPVAISSRQIMRVESHMERGGCPVWCKESLVTAGGPASFWVSSSCVVVVVVCRCESVRARNKSQGWGPGSFDVMSLAGSDLSVLLL